MRKTIFTLGLMLAAALSLTNCTKNEEANFTPEVKVPFEFYANMDDTRTVNDGMSTKWVAGDAINVFHAEVNTANYKNDGSFSTEDATGLFKGTLAGELTAATYDWYAIYPYVELVTTPANTTSGYVYIGGRSDTPQVQNGNNSTTHIAGKNYPLVGVAKGVAASEKPAITMSHISSLVEFNVTNKLTEDITVTSIALKALEDIVGTYYIDFTGKTIDYTPGDHVSQTATLNVSNGAAIKPGESAKFYMAIKPTEFDGDNILITVNAKTANGTGTMEIEKEVETAFLAGKKKTLKIGFNAEIEEVTESKYNMISTLDKLTAGQYYMAGYATEYNNQGVITTFDPYPYHIWTGGISTGNNTDLMTVNYSYENGSLVINPNLSAQDAAKGTAQFVELVAVEGKANTYYIKFGGKYLTCTGKRAAKLVDTAVEWAFSAHTKGGICITDTSSNVILGTAGATYNMLRCYASPASSLVYGVVFFAATDGEVELTPYLSASNISGVSVDGVTDATTSFTAQNLTEDITVTCDGDVVTAATVTDLTITYSVSKNETDAAREGWIQLAANGVVTKITVSQEGATQTVTINQVTSAGNYVVTGTVVAVGNQAYIIGDNTGVMMVYHSNSGRTVGENITISGAVTIYKSGTSFGTPQFTNAATVTVNSEGNTWSYNPTVLDSAGVEAMLNETLAQEVQIAGKYVVSGNYVNIEIDGTTTQGSIKYVDNSLYSSFSGKNVIIKGYFVGASSGKYVNILPYSIEEDGSVTPEPEPEPEPEPTDGVYTLLTNLADLKVGDKIVIAAKDYNYAMSTNQADNNRGQAAITKSGDTITFGTDVQILTVEAGKVSGTFAFNTGSGYLYAASSSKNYLKTEATLSNNSSWKVTFENDGTLGVKAQGSFTRNVMQYNQTSSLFACYSAASQKAIVIYRLVK